MNGIITVTLNPAIDVHYYADKFVKGADNMMSERIDYAAGKGINVSRALKSVGVSAEAFMLLGEENASKYLLLAKDYGVPISSITTSGTVRENISINTPKSETRLCIRGNEVSPAVLPVLASQIVRKLTPDMAVVFSGSLPKGISQGDFISFVMMIKNAVPDIKIVLDSPSITMATIAAIQPFLVKPNLFEAKRIIAHFYKNDEPFDFHSAEGKQLAIRFVREICMTGKCDHCVVSCGADGAAYATVASLSSGFISAPSLENTSAISTVGAGDSMLAGILYYFLKSSNENNDSNFEYDLEKAVKWGIAFGSAACRKP